MHSQMDIDIQRPKVYFRLDLSHSKQLRCLFNYKYAIELSSEPEIFLTLPDTRYPICFQSKRKKNLLVFFLSLTNSTFFSIIIIESPPLGMSADMWIPENKPYFSKFTRFRMIERVRQTAQTYR